MPTPPTNRLAGQTSPYLLQHAHNPVAWWPWCDEAFDEATRRGVPVFLSIGYSTCYWCHVMERESFESEAIAAILNAHFVSIKVDREERPDIDDVYMAATVMMTGHGGWPMSVFLEPRKRRPFWCGTYFPAEPRHGMNMPTFPQVLQSLSTAYVQQADQVELQAEEVAKAVREQLAGPVDPAPLRQEQVSNAVAALLKIFDQIHGGFGRAPKFPQPVFLEFLLDARARAADEATSNAIDHALRLTLDKMACGGLRDHVGGGFHRYSVDAVWLVPHFEKMLYDNAQLARAYARAARLYSDPWYAQVARQTLEYVQREMTHPDGGFYSAQDAEVDGREGLNYLWTREQLQEVLGHEQAAFAARVYAVDQGPNFRDPHHPSEPSGNILRLDDRPDRIAGALGISIRAFDEQLGDINARLYAARMQRKQPRLDDKVLTSWNGLMIGAFALAARELADPTLLNPATNAAAFIMEKMLRPSQPGGSSQLMHSWRDGKTGAAGFLEDHACLLHALLELHKSPPQGDGDYLKSAKMVLELAKNAFFDPQTGAMYDTRENSSNLFVRTRSAHDGAMPAGVSVMINSLLDLAEVSGEAHYSALALNALAAISGAVAESPVGSINSTRALLRILSSDDAAPGRPSQGVSTAPSRAIATAPTAGTSAVLPVEIYASVDRVAVSESAPGTLTLVVNIAPGYHVPAADPGGSPIAQALTPFRVGIINGQGVSAFAAYPEGGRYGDPPIRVYTGSFELEVALEAGAARSGRPLLSVSYQACTDTECLAPVIVELDIAIDEA